jgi:CNT family concentrative nucleoside transporter
VLYVPVGRDILVGVSDAVSSVIGYGQNGIEFLFGGLVGNKMFEVFGGGGFVFAFRVLPVIIFFSSLIAVLYYLGIMQWVIKLLGGGLQKVLGTSVPNPSPPLPTSSSVRPKPRWWYVPSSPR